MRRRTSAYPLLVVEPDPTRRAAVSQFLRARGFDVTSVADAQESSVWVEQEEYALAVVGLGEACEGAGQRGGLDALRAIRRALPQCQIVVILPSKVDLSSCCEAVSLGACSFVDGGGGMVPPGLLARLRQAVGRFEAIREEARQLHDRGIFDQTGFAGQSRQMAELLLQASNLSERSIDA
ncbi:MAG: hypothetical protein ACE5K7_04155, partial [Phycisphaerae bacterium]